MATTQAIRSNDVEAPQIVVNNFLRTPHNLITISSYEANKYIERGNTVILNIIDRFKAGKVNTLKALLRESYRSSAAINNSSLKDFSDNRDLYLYKLIKTINKHHLIDLVNQAINVKDKEVAQFYWLVAKQHIDLNFENFLIELKKIQILVEEKPLIAYYVISKMINYIRESYREFYRDPLKNFRDPLPQPPQKYKFLDVDIRNHVQAESGLEGAMKSVLPAVTNLLPPSIAAMSNIAGAAMNADKPTDPMEIPRFVPNTVTGLSQGVGLDRSSRLCLIAGSSTIQSSDFVGTQEDDMDLLKIAKIPTRLDKITWKSSDPAGTRLAHIPVCPNLFVEYSTDTSVTPNVEIITPTLLGYISRGFKDWRGSLNYDIEVIASQMHTGRIMLSYSAGININPANFGQMSFLNTKTMDLQEMHEINYPCPFMSERTWLRCDRFRRMQNLGAAENDKQNFENSGFLDIYVLNRLAHPESVSSEVELNIMISAGPDFRLNVPSDFAGCQGLGSVIKATSVKAEAGINTPIETKIQNTTFSDQRETTQDEGFITTQKETDLKEETMPEDRWQVADVMQKPIPIWSGDWSTGDANGKIIKQWLVPGDTLFGPHYNEVATFTFIRLHPSIRFQMNGTKFHQGRLIAAFIPLYEFAAYDDKLYSINNFTSFPHVKLDASMANSGSLEIPFVHMNTYFNTYSGDRRWQSLGMIVLAVFNQLKATTAASQSVGITAWISYNNAELQQPCPFHTPTLPKSESGRNQEAVTNRTQLSSSSTIKGTGIVKDVSGATMGEDCCDLKNLFRRYTKMYSGQGLELSNGDYYMTYANNAETSAVNKPFSGRAAYQCRTPLTHYSQLFSMWSGSLRYKLIFSIATNDETATLINQQFTIKVYHMQGVYQYGNMTPTQMTDDQRAMFGSMESLGTMVAVTNTQSSMEFEIPYYSTYSRLKVMSPDSSNARNTTGLVFITISSPHAIRGGFLSYDLYVAAGDDYLTTYLRAAPRIQFPIGSETQRDLSDNCPFIYSKIPPIFPPVAGSAGALAREREHELPEMDLAYALHQTRGYKNAKLAYAEMAKNEGSWTNYIPGSQIVNKYYDTTDKVDMVCDTANHVLQQVAKKIGIVDKDEEEDQNMTTLMEDASSIVSPMIPAIEGILNYLKMIPGTLADHFNQNLVLSDIIIEVSNITSGLISYNSSTNMFVRIAAIVTIVSTLLKGITVAVRNQIYQLCVTMYTTLNGSKQGNQLPQAEADYFSLIAPLTASLGVGIGAIFFKNLPTDKEFTQFCKNITEKFKLFNTGCTVERNIKAVWAEMRDQIQWTIDYVLQSAAPHLFAQMKLQNEFTNIEEWAAFIDSLDNIAYCDKIHYDMEFKKKLFCAIDQGREYNTLILNGKCGKAASVVREYVRKITEIGLKCENSKNELPFRKDPFCIFMHGTTNIGKSGCITSLGFDIMNHAGYPRHNRWCSINCSEKFFSENYRQQTAVYFDDFGTFTDEEQYKKFFNLKANTAYPLDMAFRKGEYFNSDFVFATTNTPYPAPNFLTSTLAFLRRRDILIEAEWADDEAIQTALARGDPMDEHRQLDCSHLKFRICNSSDSNLAPSEWMTYTQIVAICQRRAVAHLNRQQQKLTYDLQRCGYVLPQAEIGERRKICIEATKNSPSLALFNPDLWTKLEWDSSAQEFLLFSTEEDDITQEWEDCRTFFQTAGLDIQKHLRDNSYEVKEKVTLMSKIKHSLVDFKGFLATCTINIYSEHPWIKSVGKWALILSAAVIASSYLWSGTKAVIHKCACHVLTHYGFRCGFCGKWPKMENVSDNYKPFILHQWCELYGNLPYKDSHFTTIQEEAALLSVHKNRNCEIKDCYLGTRSHAESLYSDVTVGKSPTRVIANRGPYNIETSGKPNIKVTAHGSAYEIADKAHPPHRVIAQSGNVETLIETRIIPYLYRVATRGGPGFSGNNLKGFAIGDRKILLNKHLFFGCEYGSIFDIYHNGAWMPIEFEESRCTFIDGKDYLIYDLPLQFHQHKSNVQHFISEKELGFLATPKCILAKLDATLRPTLVYNLKAHPIQELKYRTDMDGTEYIVNVRNAWQYESCTTSGDCGSPLICADGKFAGKIIGIHSAGTPKEASFSQLITREMLEKHVTIGTGTPIPSAKPQMGNIIPSGHLGRIGLAENGKEFFQSNKSDIIKTDIHSLITPPVTFPSVLSPKDPRLTIKTNPLTKGISKYAQCALPFPFRHREIVNEFMQDEVKMFRLSRRPEVLTLEQAIVGIPELEGYERLPMNTSPGYPWVLTRPTGELGKKYLFDINTNLPIRKLQDALEKREFNAKQGMRVESVWVDCLKDERRPLPKIQTGSTRVFTIPPVDFSILLRKYTLDFSVAVKNSRDFMDCKVGIDPQSLEWTTLYYWLTSFASKFVAGDFSSFDGSMPADLMDDVRIDIEEFYKHHGTYTQEDSRTLQTLFDELIHTIHLARNEFYVTHQGNKSGNPITVILNSRINKRYMALAWLGLCERFQKYEYYSMSAFHQNVRSAIYGDDNLLAIKDEVVEWYNQETISQYLEMFGITYTNETKTGITKFKPINECGFLKQTFHNHEIISHIKVPHMKKDTINELLNWTRIAPDQDELLRDNCNDALRFMYFYGKEEFNSFRNKIIKALQLKDKNFQLKTYFDFHLWFLIGAGMLNPKPGAEGEILDFAHTDTSKFIKILSMCTVAPLSLLFRTINGPLHDDGRIRNQKLAICIPSGEGKTWLCDNYPQYFIDHDDYIIPELEKYTDSDDGITKWLAAGTTMLNPQQFDAPIEDNRILLTHHPNSTNRTVLKQYILPRPNFNRNNYLNRLLLDNPIVMDRDSRNTELINMAQKLIRN